MQIRIGQKIISEEHPVFIIVDAGVNHNGDLDLAKKLIDAAARSGADAVKFQTFNPDTLITKTAKRAKYQEKNIGGEETQYEMLKRLMLKREYHPSLKDYAEDKGLIFLSTPFSLDDADYLYDLGIPAFKVGSTDCNNIPYLKHIAKKGLPIILSTGMSSLEEVKESVLAIQNEGNDQIVVLHCTTNYPTAMEEVNLKVMDTLARELGTLVGYSDHTQGIEVPIAAAARGARIIEKHFTLDRNMEGPDHKASLEPGELEAMIRAVNNIEKSLGSGIKEPAPSELEVAEVARKSIVAGTDIPKGSVLSKNMLVLKRPGIGLKPAIIEELIGRKTKEDIKKDELIKWEQIL